MSSLSRFILLGFLASILAGCQTTSLERELSYNQTMLREAEEDRDRLEFQLSTSERQLAETVKELIGIQKQMADLSAKNAALVAKNDLLLSRPTPVTAIIEEVGEPDLGSFAGIDGLTATAEEGADLGLLVNQIGLGNPHRFAFTITGTNANAWTTNSLTFQTQLRNYDPISNLPTEYINNVKYSYRLVHDALVKNRREAEVATEKALQHAQQIEQKHALVRRANKEKSEFLASMSHELRTPLNAILGYSELLLEDLEEVETLPEELLEDTRCIQVASRHLLSLLHEMLDLEQIGEAPVMMAPTRFDLIDFCEEVLASMQVMARNHGNSLSLETMLEVREVYHDPTWMRQILFNLLSNAIKFTEDGIISVAVRNTHEEDADGEEKVLIEVRDTGVGMNEQELERVFEAFTQATDHTDREFGGTGLGLALCLDLTRKMKGDLQLASEPGEGTTVTISLPRTVEERA